MSTRYPRPPQEFRTGGSSPRGATGSRCYSATRRGKTKPTEHESVDDAYAAQLLQDSDADAPLIKKKYFDQLRKETLDETISEAGSDDDERVQDIVRALNMLMHFAALEETAAHTLHRSLVIPLDYASHLATDPESKVPCRHLGEIDNLTLLRSETPIKKLRLKEKKAQSLFKAGDTWSCLQLRQDVLGLAKLYASAAAYGAEKQIPMLLADAHFSLAQAYAELQCIPQASEHCNKAIESMDCSLPSRAAAFKRDADVMLAEMLLTASPPQPEAALQHLYAAAEAQSPEQVGDLGIKVLVVQAHSLMGMSKLQEARETQHARSELEQRAAVLAAKVLETTRESADYVRLMTRLKDTKSELKEEQAFQNLLIDDARAQLDKAGDMLMEVISQEEDRLRDRNPDYKNLPYIITLWRQACEISFQQSLVESLAGKIKDQLIRLAEIHSAQATYACVPDGLMARTLKEQGAALVARSNMVKDPQADLKKALEPYISLLELQTSRYPAGSAKQATSRAEALKLVGNVYVALHQWERARTHFQEALGIFASYLGPDNKLVQDLSHRILEVEKYVNK